MNLPGSKGILKMRAQLAGSVSVWRRRVVVLSLCVCLLAAGSAQAAENQVVLPVRASETERLRDRNTVKRQVAGGRKCWGGLSLSWGPVRYSLR